MFHHGNIDDYVYVTRNNLGIAGFHASVLAPNFAVFLGFVENLIIVTDSRTVRRENPNSPICLIDRMPGVDKVRLEPIPDNNLILENTRAVQTFDDFINDKLPGAKLLSRRGD